MPGGAGARNRAMTIARTTPSPAARLPERVEWPTVAVAVAVYAGYGLLTWYYHELPGWLVLLLGGGVVAWHGSLQHEAVHGHPTPWPRLNEALVFPSLWLAIPFRGYRASHLRHHDCARLTDPLSDPESFYRGAARWRRAGPTARALLTFNNTLLGRMSLGPVLSLAAYWSEEARRLWARDREALEAWALHAAGCAPVLAWALAVCAIPPVEYLLLFVWPGLSLTLLRSFAEHQASAAPGARTAIVECGPLFSLLFLNNNLHAVHHSEPGLAWHRLPARYRARRAQVLAANGGYRFAGYGEVAARYGLRPKEPVAWPLAPGRGGADSL